MGFFEYNYSRNHIKSGQMLEASTRLFSTYVRGVDTMSDHTPAQEQSQNIPYGYCHCGCGQKTRIVKKSNKSRSWLKGEPMQFAHGHNMRKRAPAPQGFKTCAKCLETHPATTEFFGRETNHPDGFKYICKSCFKERRAASVEWQAAYYAASDKELRRERARLWRANHRDEARAIEARRRARKCNAQGSHTADDVKRQYEAQKGKCYYCKQKVGKDYHADHAIPLSRGGSDGPENIVVTCPTCNLRKRNKLPHEWMQGGRLL